MNAGSELSSAAGRGGARRTDGRAQLLIGVGQLSGALPLLVLPVIAIRNLGADSYGIWVTLSALVTISGALDLGAQPYLFGAVDAMGPSRQAAVRATWMTVIGTVLTAVLGLGVLLVQNSTQTRHPASLGMIAAVWGATTLGCVLRSVFLALSSLFVFSGRLLRRAVILGSYGAMVCLLSALALWAGWGLWALSVPIIVSSAVLLVAILVSAEFAAVTEDIRPDTRNWTGFMRARAAAMVAGLVLTQGDRWYLAVLVSPSRLETYDLAARYAAIPKTLGLTIAPWIMAQLTGRDGHTYSQVYRASQRRFVSIMAVSAIASMLLAAVAGRAAGVNLTGYIALTVGLMIANCVHGLTAPGTIILSVLGRSRAEIYACLTGVVAIFVGVLVAVGAHTAVSSPDRQILMVLTPAIGLIAMAGYFLSRVHSEITSAAGT